MLKDKFAKLMYYIFIGTLLFIGFLTGKIKASTLTYNYSKVYVQGVTNLGQEPEWTTSFNLGDYIYYNETPLNVSPYLSSIRVRFGSDTKFQQGTTYTVKINTIWGQSLGGSLYQLPDRITCQGSSTSSWSSDYNLINTCEFIGRSLYNENNNASYYFKITTNSTIYGIQIAWYYKKPPNNIRLYLPDIQNIRVLPSSKITYDNSTNEAINSMSDNITINQNKNTENIINNNNENTDEIINNQNEMLGNKCANLLNIKDITDNLTFDSSGNTFTANDYFITNDFIQVESNTSYIFNKTGGIRIVEYNSSKGFIQRSFIDRTFTTTSNTKYIKISALKSAKNEFMLNKGTTSKAYCEFGTFQSKLDDTNNSINDLNDTMKDSSVDDPSGDFTQFESKVANNGVITQLITLPITFYSKVLSNLNGSCQAMDLGVLYGTNLQMPCVNIGSYLGNTLWTLIDLIISGMFIWFIAKKMIKVFNNFSEMKEGDVVGD